MLKRGYKPVMAMGPIMAIGGVDMLIPPSALTVLLATLASGMSSARMPVADLLIAGVVPGLIMSVLFIGYIVGRCALDPSIAPKYAAETYSWRNRILPFVKYVVPLFVIVVVVIGSIFAGIASPTDSAALGCAATVLVAMAYRSLTLKALVRSLTETALVTVMILFIIGASVSFAQIISLSGATEGALGEVAKLPFTPFQFILIMIAILLILGCFVDQVSMMLLTLPFFMPMVAKFGYDPVWFGTLFLIAMQVGLLSPPFGLLLYVMKGVAPPDTTLGEISRAAAPFIVLMLVTLLLVLFVPGVATWLPSLISR
jgi:tripartite ATP-independent transporter DctM subunit